MQLEQAVFTSAQTKRSRGYHLVARSPGISDRLAEMLGRWGPTHGSLLEKDVHTCCYSFFPTLDGSLAVARTVYGGPEYSGRGGLQIVTFILTLQLDDLSGYRFDVLSLARTALGLGYLRVTDKLTGALSPVEIPRDAPLAFEQRQLPDPGADVERVISLLERRQRLAVLGVDDPTTLMQHILANMSRDQRAQVSFTTGLRPSSHRTFQLNLYPSSNDTLARHFRSVGIETLECGALT